MLPRKENSCVEVPRIIQGVFSINFCFRDLPKPESFRCRWKTLMFTWVSNSLYVTVQNHYFCKWPELHWFLRSFPPFLQANICDLLMFLFVCFYCFCGGGDFFNFFFLFLGNFSLSMILILGLIDIMIFLLFFFFYISLNPVCVKPVYQECNFSDNCLLKMTEVEQNLYKTYCKSFYTSRKIMMLL